MVEGPEFKELVIRCVHITECPHQRSLNANDYFSNNNNNNYNDNNATKLFL